MYLIKTGLGIQHNSGIRNCPLLEAELHSWGRGHQLASSNSFKAALGNPYPSPCSTLWYELFLRAHIAAGNISCTQGYT